MVASVEQAVLHVLRRMKAKMLPAWPVEAASARGAGDEAKLDQIGLDHFLDCIARLGKAGGQRLDADRTAAINVRNHHQIAPVHEVESKLIDLQPLQRGVGVRFKGEEKTNVEEYCVSEGWVRLALGNRVDRKGKALTVKLQGTVEPYFQNG